MTRHRFIRHRRLHCQHSIQHASAYLLPLLTLALILASQVDRVAWATRWVSQATSSVAVVSAASYTPVVAPDSIAVAFGVGLALRTEAAAGDSLPTSLAGTTVRINGELAQLFLVSPGQVNFLVPASVPLGAQNIVITAGTGMVARGTVQIARAAPGLFTANANGGGVPAAVALRVKADGTQSLEPVADFSQAPFRTRPLELGPESDQLYLILFGTGIRGRANLTEVAARIGGVNARVDFAGAQGLAGLDQVNVLLPRELRERGRVNLALNLTGAGVANLVEVEIAGAANIAPPQVAGYSAVTALAGSSLTINGAGFSPSAAENTVRIGGVEARVEAASATQLTIRIPFGAQSGPVSVRTPQGEGQGTQVLQLRTSISGVVEDTRRQPLAGVTVRIIDKGIQAVTGAEGSFLLPDVPAALAQEIEIDGGTVLGSLPYPKVILKKRVQANRDNQMESTVALQQISGPGITVGASAGACSPAFRRNALSLAPAHRQRNALIPNVLPPEGGTTCQQLPAQTLRTGNVTFEIPAGAAVSFPGGVTRSTLNLTLVENSRPPVTLPPGLFSLTIPQLTPFSAVILPGGKLTLPNDERYPTGTLVKLLRFDQTPRSPTIGEFVEAGTATVSADGQRLETAPNAITEITQYFVAAPRQTTTVVGRVVDSDGRTPVRQALVRGRGQEAFTDGNGGFTLPGVVVNPGDMLSVEASFVRANGRVDRTQRSGIVAVVNGLTAVTPELILPAENSNRPPVLLAPIALRVNEGETRTLDFLASDPDGGQTVQVALTGPAFATLLPRGNGIYTLRFQTAANDAGQYTLMLTASDNLNLSTTLNLRVTVNRIAVANAQAVTTEEDVPKAITLAGNDPDGDALNFILVSNPSRGQLSGTPPNLMYTPNANYNGTDSFSFKVNDGITDSAVATVSINVTPVNDPPVLLGVPEQRMLEAGQNLTFTLSAFDVDEGQTLSFSATNLPGGAAFNVVTATNAQFSWTPSETQFGNYTISFNVTDNGTPPQSDTKTLVVTVLGRWRQTAGPEGGLINVLLTNGTTLFAGTRGGVFRSPNQGQSWTAINEGLRDLSIGALAVLGANLFVATDDKGVYRSTNNGDSWVRVGPDFTEQVYSFGVNGSTLFAGTFQGVYRSTDQGQTWTPVNKGLPLNAYTAAFAVSGSSLFVGFETGGVYRSTDQGQNWTPVNTGLPNLNILKMAVSGGNIFAAPRESGVYRSTDQGQTWTPVNNGLTNGSLNSLTANGSELLAGTTHAGVFRSTNQGESWTDISVAGTSTAIFSLAISGSNYFAGTVGGGVFRSTDQGRNWASSNLGLTSSYVSALASLNALLFAGTKGSGVALSFNTGQTWTPINTNLTGDYVNALLVNGANLYVGTNDGLFVSANNGAQWTRRNTGLPDAILALLANGGDLFVGTNNGVFRSTDQGQSWLPARDGIADKSVGSLIFSGGNFFAGTYENGVYLSTNRGQSWTRVNTGLTNLEVTALAASGTVLLAGTQGGGVFRSVNQGQNWTPANTGLPHPNVNALLVNGANIFAGTGGGVFVSANQGQSWTALNAGLTDLRVQSLGISGANLAAGTETKGVFLRPL